jgi:dTDP-4-amino-4,6-dideoxy-D-galactose acyltransferase
VEVTGHASAIRRLDWDSSFFGFSIGEARATTRDELVGADQEGGREQLRCLYLLVRSEHFHLVQQAEALGFRLTGVRMSFLAQAPFRADLTGTGATRVRPAQTADVAALEQIATTAHPDTRFFADPEFTRQACEQLYATWIRRSIEGWADQVFVADQDTGAPGAIGSSAPVGYVTLHRSGDAARIGLIAVASGTRRAGVGRALMMEAFRWCDAQRVQGLSVATQAQNTSALRFYMRCGFGVDGVDFWLHKWW